MCLLSFAFAPKIEKGRSKDKFRRMNAPLIFFIYDISSALHVLLGLFMNTCAVPFRSEMSIKSSVFVCYLAGEICQPANGGLVYVNNAFFFKTAQIIKKQRSYIFDSYISIHYFFLWIVDNEPESVYLKIDVLNSIALFILAKCPGYQKARYTLPHYYYCIHASERKQKANMPRY